MKETVTCNAQASLKGDFVEAITGEESSCIKHEQKEFKFHLH